MNPYAFLCNDQVLAVNRLFQQVAQADCPPAVQGDPRFRGPSGRFVQAQNLSVAVLRRLDGLHQDRPGQDPDARNILPLLRNDLGSLQGIIQAVALPDNAAVPRISPVGIDRIGKAVFSDVPMLAGAILAPQQAQVQDVVPEFIAIFAIVQQGQAPGPVAQTSNLA